MHYEKFYVKYKGVKRGYINYRFMKFSDLELSFWFKLRYFKAVFCDKVSMEAKRVILARFVDFDVAPTNVLPWQPHVRLKKKSLFNEIFLKNQF